MLGGTLNDTYGPSSNSCATRASHALNNSGSPIPYIKNVSNKNFGGNEKSSGRYIISASDFNNYLTSAWGNPDQVVETYVQSVKLQKSLSNGQVAIMVDVDEFGTGHVAILTSSYRDEYAYGGNVWLLPTAACKCN